jgi:tRNA(Ile)-lysidine synthase
MLANRFLEADLQDCKLSSAELILVGLSGGPDSMCLLDLLRRAGFNLICGHLDHGMRENSEWDTQVLKSFMQEQNIPLEVRKEDVNEYANRNGMSLEEAGRNLRYRFLFQTAKEHHCQAVAVGHNADDQVETLLMHLIRGSGLAGLCGMQIRTIPNPWSSEIPLVRPLLSYWREEIERYLDGMNLPVLQDPSNTNTRYFRNEIRHELVPQLESLNPGVKKNLLQMSKVVEKDFAYITKQTTAAWKRTVLLASTEQVSFELREFNQVPENIQAYILQRAFYHLRPDLRDLNFETIRKAIGFVAESRVPGEIDFAGGLRMVIDSTGLHISEWNQRLRYKKIPYILPGNTTVLDIPGKTALSDRWEVCATEVNYSEFTRELHAGDKKEMVAWFDWSQPEFPISTRAAEQGESIRPLGMAGNSKKINDVYINNKVPKDARPSYPILFSGEVILWVPGLVRSQELLVGEDSSRIIRLELNQREYND